MKLWFLGRCIKADASDRNCVGKDRRMFFAKQSTPRNENLGLKSALFANHRAHIPKGMVTVPMSENNFHYFVSITGQKRVKSGDRKWMKNKRKIAG